MPRDLYELLDALVDKRVQVNTSSAQAFIEKLCDRVMTLIEKEREK